MKTPLIAVTAFVALVLSGCVNLDPAPDMSKDFSLGPVAISSKGGSAANGISIFVSRPQIPGYVDRTRLTYRAQSGQVDELSDAYWAEPLVDGIARSIALYLGNQAETVTINYFPGPDDRANGLNLATQFNHFDATSSGGVFVSIEWTLADGDSVKASGRLELSDLSWDTQDPASLIAAYNQALRTLANEVSESL